MKPYWDIMAGQFQHQGLPLRPCPDEIAVMQAAALDYLQAEGNQNPRVLMFGVTPEIAEMAWPDGTHLTALERSIPMIEKVWPGNVPGRREVVMGDWSNMVEGFSEKDLLIGDGFLTAVPYSGGLAALMENVSRVLKPGGLFIVRVFMRPEQGDSMENIELDMQNGRYGTFHALKFRLAHALQEDISQGVDVGSIYEAWLSLERKLQGLASRAGWHAPEVETIRLYKDRRTRYHFPVMEEFMSVASTWFERVSVVRPGDPSYPILILKSRRQSS